MTTIKNIVKALGDKADLLLVNTPDDIIKDIIKTNTAMVKSYLALYNKTNTRSPVLSKICLSLCIADIYRRNASNDIPQFVIKQEENAFSTLEKIQKNKIIISNEDSTIFFNSKKRLFK
jgi:hypothetical protein